MAECFKQIVTKTKGAKITSSMGSVLHCYWSEETHGFIKFCYLVSSSGNLGYIAKSGAAIAFSFLIKNLARQ